MIIESYASTDALEHTKKELSKIPNHVLNIIKQLGYPILIFDKYPSIIYKGYLDKEYLLDDKRKLSRCSHFATNFQWIYLYAGDLIGKDPISVTVLHELGHALDYALGNGGYYYSELHPEIFKHGKPLDWYAAKDDQERFATCFESMFSHDTTIKEYYYEHTKKDVLYTEPEMFKFFNTLLKI